MPYVLKDSSGKIIASSQVKQDSDSWHMVTSDDREYIEYLEDTLAQSAPFRESDIGLARVLEDLISLLIERDVIRFTDFPRAAQKRLIERQKLRNANRLHGLLDESQDIAL